MNDDKTSNVHQIGSHPAGSDAIDPEVQVYADELLNDALDAINDAAAKDPMVKAAERYYMLAKMGITDHVLGDPANSTFDIEWVKHLSDFYTSIFARAAAMQSPIEATIATGMEIDKQAQISGGDDRFTNKHPA